MEIGWRVQRKTLLKKNLMEKMKRSTTGERKRPNSSENKNERDVIKTPNSVLKFSQQLNKDNKITR